MEKKFNELKLKYQNGQNYVDDEFEKKCEELKVRCFTHLFIKNCKI